MMDIVSVMMGAEVETTVRDETREVIEAGKGREGSKSSIEILDEGGVEVPNEIGTGSFTGGELNARCNLKSHGMSASEAG